MVDMLCLQLSSKGINVKKAVNVILETCVVWYWMQNTN